MSLRDAMPATAALVDELRAALGRDLVDAAIRNGVAMRREYEQIAAERGQDMADRWWAEQSGGPPRFTATEAGRTVGMLPPARRVDPISPRDGRRARVRRVESTAVNNGATPGHGSSLGPAHEGNSNPDHYVDRGGSRQ